MTALTAYDRGIITRARQLADTSNLEAVRSATADSRISTYAEAFGVARVRLGDLLAIIERLEADASRLRNDRARYRVQLKLTPDNDDREALREAGQPGRLVPE